MLQHRFWNLLAKKLANEATAEEMQELEELIRLHPDWYYAAQHIEDIWGLSMKENSQAAEDSYLRHLNRMKKIGIAPADPDDETNLKHHPHRNKKRVLVFSLIGLAILATVLFYSPNKKKSQLAAATSSEVSTRPGSRSKLLLPDGSVVWLNAGSKLTYSKDFGASAREVNLVGEGYFEVTRMHDVPFIIHTPTMQVKVLGTTFNVKSYLNDETSETSVIKGSVEVLPKQRPGEKFVLKSNEKLVLSNTSKKETKQQSNIPMIVLKSVTYAAKDSSVVETSWVENKLVFDDETFAEVALKMERWYAVKIIFEDKNIERMHLTGSFVNENIQQALAALQISSNFHYRINAYNIITITK